ncbi:2-phosphosulfolactate phosphatase [Streptomyces sp. NPDC001508]|uniref:2-phosphosulfolactate phosphatase n=1 Tax=Streptomyces sp. NPDC001508 TaxID=3154656 RepID=UPI0033326B85
MTAPHRAAGIESASSFDPWPDSPVHLDWGIDAAQLAASRGDAVVIVDALSFSTTVILAVAHGAAVLPLARAELERTPDLAELEAEHRARLLANDPADRQLGDVLTDVGKIQPGDRVIVPSQNGGTICSAITDAPAAAIGSFRNRTATAEWGARLLAAGTVGRLTLVAAGSSWSQMGSRNALRPCIEDGVAAGAVAAALRDSGLGLSVEASAMAAAFDDVHSNHDIATWLRDTVTGRWLKSLDGPPDDVIDAGRLDASPVVPSLAPDGFFHDAMGPGRTR